MAEVIKRETTVTKTVENPQQFVMVKNFRGALAVELSPSDLNMPARTIHFKYDQETQYVPAKFALGVFVNSPNALRQMEKGYFTFEKLDVLIKMAEEAGYYVPDIIKSPVITLKDIKAALLKNDVRAIEKLMINPSAKNIRDLVAVAQKVYESLNNSIVNYIEKTYKVSISPVKLND